MRRLTAARPRVLTRRGLFVAASALVPALGRGAGTDLRHRLRQVDLPNLVRIDAAERDGWLARDRDGRMWRVGEDGSTQVIAGGLRPDAPLDAGHGLIASIGEDGRLWVARDSDSRRSNHAAERLAPHGGLRILEGAIVGLVDRDAATVVARFEPGTGGRWVVRSTSMEAVLPDAEPVLVDLDGRRDGGHVAVLAGPDGERYPHGVLGDAVEATRVVWLDRHSLRTLRALDLEAPHVFEDRILRPWRLPDGRLGLVTVQAGPVGAQLVVLTSSSEPARLRIEAHGPPIGRRNRWMSPASVVETDPRLLAIHTPHIGGVLHRYTMVGSHLTVQTMVSGLTNHRLGARRLDDSVRVGSVLLTSAQDWDAVAVVDLDAPGSVQWLPMPAPIIQLAGSGMGSSVAVLTSAGVSIWRPQAHPRAIGDKRTATTAR